ncbi:DUF58 domain-containing protein [Yoonia sp. MH D7]
MTTAANLRANAQTLSDPLPALLAQADHLASSIILGDHGRRRAGTGDTFWQYRAAQSGDDLRQIDWRRSARADTNFVADKEWQTAQTVLLWVDQSASMSFTSDDDTQTKSACARTLALATAILLDRGGERIGLTDARLPAKRGAGQIRQMAQILTEDDSADYASPSANTMPAYSRAVFISDFLGDIKGTETALHKAADNGVRGALLQVLDAQEEAFPFHGRTIFQSMGGDLHFETLQAGDLRSRYLDRLAERKDALANLARTTGWQFHTHHTNTPATSALLWLYQSLARRA